MANANPTRANAQLIKLLQRQLSWYYHNFTAEQTANRLSNGQHGEFLVRKESGEGKYALCVRTNDEICIIEITSDGTNYSLQNEIHFTSIYDLLVCFTIEQHQLFDKNKGQIALTSPCVRQYTCSGYVGRMPGQLIEKKLKEFKGQARPFIISDDMTIINQFALSVLVEPNRVKHYKILCEGDQYFLDSGTSPSRKFPDLKSLVDHYRNSSLVDDEDIEITLGPPAITARPVSTRPGPVRPVPSPKPLSTLPVAPIAAAAGLVAATSASASTTNPAKIDEEFEILTQQEEVYKSETSSDYAAKPENKQRNRYKNIHPFDFTRVVLEDADPNIPGDDYINASILMSGTRKAYIPCQGCLPSTISHYWRMVWQEKVTIIVMVTLCVEAGKNKCAQYWPKSVGNGGAERFQGYGFRLILTLDNERQSQNRDYVIRRMTLIREDDMGNGTYQEIGKRNITQFHYLQWPDKKTPTNNDWFLSYIEQIRDHQNVRAANARETGPVAVHCSAGIGRTGTFIIICMMIDQLKKNPGAEVNIKQLVSEARRQRAGMVQTIGQYRFLYAFLDFYKQKYSAVSSEQVQLYVNYNPNAPIYENTGNQQHPV